MYFVIFLILLIIYFLWKTKETFENISPNYNDIDNYNDFKYDTSKTVLEEQSWKPVGTGPERVSKNNVDATGPTNQLSLEDIKSYFFSLKKDNEVSNSNNNSGPTHCIGIWDNEWSQCSKQCGGGVQKKFYKVLQKAGPNGIPCSYEDGDSIDQKCNLLECPINCEGKWSDWSECDKDCFPGAGDYGETKRQFSITTVAKDGYINDKFKKALPCSYGDDITDDGDIQKQECNTEYCPIDCKGSYAGFKNDCSESCGGGKKENIFNITRYPVSGWFRGVQKDGAACPSNKTLTCNTQPCPK